MPYLRPHPNGHEPDGEGGVNGVLTMQIQEENDCFVAGFLRSLYVPEAQPDEPGASIAKGEGSTPSGDSTSAAMPCS